MPLREEECDGNVEGCGEPDIQLGAVPRSLPGPLHAEGRPRESEGHHGLFVQADGEEPDDGLRVEADAPIGTIRASRSMCSTPTGTIATGTCSRRRCGTRTWIDMSARCGGRAGRLPLPAPGVSIEPSAPTGTGDRMTPLMPRGSEWPAMAKMAKPRSAEARSLAAGPSRRAGTPPVPDGPSLRWTLRPTAPCRST